MPRCLDRGGLFTINAEHSNEKKKQMVRYFTKANLMAIQLGVEENIIHVEHTGRWQS